MQQKKVQKTVESGRIYITATFNESPPKEICKSTCVFEQTEVTSCSGGGGILVGGVVGFLVGGPVGAIIGGAAGNAMDTTDCVKSIKPVENCTLNCVPDPAYEKHMITPFRWI